MSIIKKLINWIVSIPSDKLLHFIAGAGVNLYSFAIAYRIHPTSLLMILSALITITVLVAKELYDLSHEGHSFEWLDIVAGIVGIVLTDGAMMVMLL